MRCRLRRDATIRGRFALDMVMRGRIINFNIRHEIISRAMIAWGMIMRGRTRRHRTLQTCNIDKITCGMVVLKAIACVTITPHLGKRVCAPVSVCGSLHSSKLLRKPFCQPGCVIFVPMHQASHIMAFIVP